MKGKQVDLPTIEQIETELKDVKGEFVPDDEIKAMYKQLIQK